MPHLNKLRSAFFQIVVLLCMVTITGNLISNYQERHMMRNEISNIRNSLHNLKDTIINIGTTYDNLYNDITSFVTVENIEPQNVNHLRVSYKKANNSALNKVFLLEQLNDVNINHLEKDQIEEFIPQEANNESTITRNPLKATGVGSESITLLPQCPIRRGCLKTCPSRNNIHKCYKKSSIKSCSCNFSYWKF